MPCRTKIAVSGLVARTALVLARGNAFFQPAALLLLRNLYYYIGAPTAPGTRTQWSQNQETLVQTFVQLAGMGFTVPVLKFVRAHAAEWELAHLRAFMTTLVAAMSPPLSFDAAFEFTALVSAMQRRIIAENAARAGLGDTSAALLRIADEGSAKLKELLGHAFRPHCIIPPPQHIATTEAQAQLCALVRRIEEDAKKHNVL
ncbi:hypothetical protein EON68_00020 [archaeon]|nr:MAG: hypothetical protein EON68_00020 [archaeon]